MPDSAPVRRKRMELEIVYFEDGRGDDYESLIVNAVVSDGMALILVETVEDVTLVPGKDPTLCRRCGGEFGVGGHGPGFCEDKRTQAEKDAEA